MRVTGGRLINAGTEGRFYALPSPFKPGTCTVCTFTRTNRDPSVLSSMQLFYCDLHEEVQSFEICGPGESWECNPPIVSKDTDIKFIVKVLLTLQCQIRQDLLFSSVCEQ